VKKLLILSTALLGLISVGCSEMQQIPMNQAQTDAYNSAWVLTGRLSRIVLSSGSLGTNIIKTRS
jgi:uncharacterized protein YcfL